MHWLLFLEQALVPFGLLTWLALAPLRSGVGFGVQAGSTALVVLALSLTGPWLLVPWWVGYAYGGAWLLLAGRGWWHPPAGEAASRGVGQWVRLGLFTALGLLGAWQAWLGWHGRALPTAPAVELRFPLAAGRYLVVSGGTNLSLNPHAARGWAPPTPSTWWPSTTGAAGLRAWCPPARPLTSSTAPPWWPRARARCCWPRTGTPTCPALAILGVALLPKVRAEYARKSR